ncbi:hypothetical protein H4R34_001756 [Dimargaris verticillata]|uniref:DNA replication checkpoint mediator MRC1 domain-containing protein n=1 Tax=Dimargaris verticillata TaxID=2761393 RepID=A0A9W8B308_9FUNG|nr:hypothetical protein H4R34_001756 [Dimargaris verticillata]
MATPDESAKPQRATKQELLEMHRESDRLIRSAPVVMEPRVNKKLTMGSFLARFQAKTSITTSPVKAPIAPSSPTTSSPNTVPVAEPLPSNKTPNNVHAASDEEDELELEIIDDELALQKEQRAQSMSTLLTGINRFQSLIKSPDKRSNNCSLDDFCTKPLSPVKKAPVLPAGIGHKQLNQLLTQKILHRASQRHLHALDTAGPTTVSMHDPTGAERHSAPLTSTDDEAEPAANVVEAHNSSGAELSDASGNESNADLGTDDDSDNDAPRHRPTRTLKRPSQALTHSPPEPPASTAQLPSSSSSAQPLFPLFKQVGQPKVAVPDGGNTLQATVDSDATMTLSPTTHGLLGVGGATMATSTDQHPPLATGGLSNDAAAVANATTKWFDATCFSDIPSPSQDSLLGSSDSNEPMMTDIPEPSPVTSVSLGLTRPPTTEDGTLCGASGLVSTQPLSPTQLLPASGPDGCSAMSPTQLFPDTAMDITNGHNTSSVTAVIATALPPNQVVVSTSLDSQRQADPTGTKKLSRLFRRKATVSNKSNPAGSGCNRSNRSGRPKSEFVDAEAEEGESDDESVDGRQTRLFQHGPLGAKPSLASGQKHDGSDQGAEDEEEDGSDLDNWDDNDSMLAYSGDEDIEGQDPSLIRQLHHEKEAQADASAIAMLSRDIAEGRLLARSRQRRRRGQPGSGTGADGELTNLADWVDGDALTENADQERRRLMWKRGLRLGQSRERGEDLAYSKLSELAKNPETAAFARSAFCIDLPEDAAQQTVDDADLSDTSVHSLHASPSDGGGESPTEADLVESSRRVRAGPKRDRAYYRKKRDQLLSAIADPLSPSAADEDDGDGDQLLAVVGNHSVGFDLDATSSVNIDQLISQRNAAHRLDFVEPDHSLTASAGGGLVNSQTNPEEHSQPTGDAALSDFTISRHSKLKRFLPDLSEPSGVTIGDRAVMRKKNPNQAFGFSTLTTLKSAQGPENATNAHTEKRRRVEDAAASSAPVLRIAGMATSAPGTEAPPTVPKGGTSRLLQILK